MPGDADPTPADLLAAVLLHAAAAGPEGRLVPTPAEVAACLHAPPPRWAEAKALAAAIVADLTKRSRPGVVEAGGKFVESLLDLSDKYGGFLSAPPLVKGRR